MEGLIAFGWAAGVTGGLAILGLALGRLRRGPALAVALLLISGIAALRLGAVTLGPGAALGEGPWWGLLLAGAWVSFGSTGRGVAPRLGPNLGLAALLGGALLGDLATAGLLATQVADPRRAARAALVASSGAMLSGVGTPATLLVAGPSQLWPLALLTAAVAWPRGAAIGAAIDAPAAAGPRPVTGSLPLTAGLVVAALVSWWIPWLGLALAMGALGASGRRPSLDRRGARALVLLAAVGGLSWLAGRSGGLWITEWGLSWAAGHLPLGGALGVPLGWLAAALGGEPSAALVLGALADAPLLPHWPGLRIAIAAGVATGGVGPLLICGGLRAGWRIWLLQLAIAVGWVSTWGIQG